MSSLSFGVRYEHEIPTREQKTHEKSEYSLIFSSSYFPQQNLSKLLECLDNHDYRGTKKLLKSWTWTTDHIVCTWCALQDYTQTKSDFREFLRKNFEHKMNAMFYILCMVKLVHDFGDNDHARDLIITIVVGNHLLPEMLKLGRCDVIAYLLKHFDEDMMKLLTFHCYNLCK